MNASSTKREKQTAILALAWLLLLGALGLFGPYGLLSWGEKAVQLEEREARIAALREEQAVLSNRVDLLDPENVDPDLATELVRRDLNVAHRDEYVVELETQP